jgi:hypothetical protein
MSDKLPAAWHRQRISKSKKRLDFVECGDGTLRVETLAIRKAVGEGL